jgi:uncharacterized protein with HEPN domain
MPHDLSRSGGGGDTPSSEDRLRVEHMLQSSRDARAIIGKDDAVALAADMIRTRAMVNCFTEIGEAAARLTPQGRIRVGQIPWRQIVGMRNIVVHVYWGHRSRGAREDCAGRPSGLDRGARIRSRRVAA